MAFERLIPLVATAYPTLAARFFAVGPGRAPWHPLSPDRARIGAGRTGCRVHRTGRLRPVWSLAGLSPDSDVLWAGPRRRSTTRHGPMSPMAFASSCACTAQGRNNFRNAASGIYYRNESSVIWSACEPVFACELAASCRVGEDTLRSHDNGRDGDGYPAGRCRFLRSPRAGRRRGRAAPVATRAVASQTDPGRHRALLG